MSGRSVDFVGGFDRATPLGRSPIESADDFEANAPDVMRPTGPHDVVDRVATNFTHFATVYDEAAGR